MIPPDFVCLGLCSAIKMYYTNYIINAFARDPVQPLRKLLTVIQVADIPVTIAEIAAAQ